MIIAHELRENFPCVLQTEDATKGVLDRSGTPCLLQTPLYGNVASQSSATRDGVLPLPSFFQDRMTSPEADVF